MAQAKKSFTHIVVNEEDDVVIQAGAPSAPAVEEDAAAADSRSEGREAVAQSPTRPEAADAGGSGKAAPKRTERAKSAADKEYRETTLDDLSGSPMSVTQKVIIALCLVGVAAAVVYCVAFMG